MDSLKPVLYDLRGYRPCGKPSSTHKLATREMLEKWGEEIEKILGAVPAQGQAL